MSEEIKENIAEATSDNPTTGMTPEEREAYREAERERVRLALEKKKKNQKVWFVMRFVIAGVALATMIGGLILISKAKEIYEKDTQTETAVESATGDQDTGVETETN